MVTGQLHPVWTTTELCTYDAKRAAIKVKLLTSTYLLQATRAKFRQINTTAMCPLCEAGDEDKIHFLLSCEKLSESRERYLPLLITLARNVFENSYNTIVQDQFLISQIITDCTVLADGYIMSHFRAELEDIEAMSRRLVYALHCRRMEIMTTKCLKLNKHKSK